MKKKLCQIIGVAWTVTFMLAFAGFLGISLPEPLATLSAKADEFIDLLLTPAIFLPLFVILWIVVLKTLSIKSGWAELAKAYAMKEVDLSSEPVPMTSISGYIGDVSFSRIYRAGADDNGIVLSSILLFRIGHPKLQLPWSVVTISEEDAATHHRNILSKLLKTQYVTLRVMTYPSFQMRIIKSDFERTNIGAFVA